jgi:AbrB family looped-hinge helix DNA binding protein
MNDDDDNELQLKTITVSQKGQITIPTDIQKIMGIKKGDKLILIQKGNKIVLEKSDKIVEKLEDEFKYIKDISEHSLKKLWLNSYVNKHMNSLCKLSLVILP